MARKLVGGGAKSISGKKIGDWMEVFSPCENHLKTFIDIKHVDLTKSTPLRPLCDSECKVERAVCILCSSDLNLLPYRQPDERAVVERATLTPLSPW